MFRITLMEEGKVKETAVYNTIEAVKDSADVKAFIDFIIENDSDTDVEIIKNEIKECETIEELKAVFVEHFDYSWLTLIVEEI